MDAQTAHGTLVGTANHASVGSINWPFPHRYSRRHYNRPVIAEHFHNRHQGLALSLVPCDIQLPPMNTSVQSFLCDFSSRRSKPVDSRKWSRYLIWKEKEEIHEFFKMIYLKFNFFLCSFSSPIHFLLAFMWSLEDFSWTANKSLLFSSSSRNLSLFWNLICKSERKSSSEKISFVMFWGRTGRRLCRFTYKMRYNLWHWKWNRRKFCAWDCIMWLVRCLIWTSDQGVKVINFGVIRYILCFLRRNLNCTSFLQMLIFLFWFFFH